MAIIPGEFKEVKLTILDDEGNPQEAYFQVPLHDIEEENIDEVEKLVLRQAGKLIVGAE